MSTKNNLLIKRSSLDKTNMALDLLSEDHFSRSMDQQNYFLSVGGAIKASALKHFLSTATEVMAVSPSAMFTTDRARSALKEIIEAFSLPNNVARLNEAKSSAGNDMILYMQLVFPLATQIQLEVIQNYGFTTDKEGLLQFTHCIKLLRKENMEVSHMDDELRQLLLPPLTMPYPPTSDS